MSSSADNSRELSRISDSLRRRNALMAIDILMKYGVSNDDKQVVDARMRITKDILAAEYKPIE